MGKLKIHNLPHILHPIYIWEDEYDIWHFFDRMYLTHIWYFRCFQISLHTDDKEFFYLFFILYAFIHNKIPILVTQHFILSWPLISNGGGGGGGDSGVLYNMTIFQMQIHNPVHVARVQYPKRTYKGWGWCINLTGLLDFYNGPCLCT